MELICDMKDLREALARVKPAVTKWNGPTSGGVLVRALENDTARLEVFSRDMTIVTPIASAVVGSAGVMVLSHKLLADAAKGKGELVVRYNPEDDLADLVNGIHQRARTMPIEDWPSTMPAPHRDDTIAWELPVEKLGWVVAAASTDMTRPVLTGVLISGNQLVATDCYRLHVETVPGECPTGKLLLSAVALRAAIKLAGKDPTITVRCKPVDPREAWITAGASTISTRLMEGDYPNYVNLIPKGFPNLVRFDRDEMLLRVSEVAKMARDCTTPLRLTCSADHVELNVITPDIGQATATVKADSDLVLQAYTIAFNPHYFAECVRTLSAGEITLGYNDHGKPGLISDGTPGRVRLLMPVKVS